MLSWHTPLIAAMGQAARGKQRGGKRRCEQAASDGSGFTPAQRTLARALTPRLPQSVAVKSDEEERFPPLA